MVVVVVVMFWEMVTVLNDEIWTRGQEKQKNEKTERRGRADLTRNEPDEAWSREHRSCSGSCGGGGCIVDLRIVNYSCTK